MGLEFFADGSVYLIYLRAKIKARSPLAKTFCNLKEQDILGTEQEAISLLS